MAPVFIKRYGKIKGSTVLFGFKIDQRTENVELEYLEDNKNFIPAKVDGETGEFDYGSWKDEFFMQIRPCMLNCGGDVAYYLNPNNYTKKEDGSVSDISNADYPGNVMVEFPKSYYKVSDNRNDTANIYISNKKLDDDFYCWPFIDKNDNEIDYCYMSAYMGKLIDSKLRSLSENVLYDANGSLIEMIDYARNNGLDNNRTDWCVEVYCDWFLLQIYAMLISKSTNTQESFGYGLTSHKDPSKVLSGYSNDKGLFYGKGFSDAVVQGNGRMKFFGIEDYWGCVDHYFAGFVYKIVNNIYYPAVKMTHGTSDGSSIEGYKEACVGNKYSIGGYSLVNDVDGISFRGTNNLITKINFTNKGFFVKEIKSFVNSDLYEDVGYHDQFYTGTYGIKSSLAPRGLYNGGGSSKNGRKYSGLFSYGGIYEIYEDTKLGGTGTGFMLSCKPSRK